MADLVIPPAASSPVLAMRSASAPRLDARYWTAISLASMVGHWLGLAPLALLFTAPIIARRDVDC